MAKFPTTEAVVVCGWGDDHDEIVADLGCWYKPTEDAEKCDGTPFARILAGPPADPMPRAAAVFCRHHLLVYFAQLVEEMPEDEDE